MNLRICKWTLAVSCAALLALPVPAQAWTYGVNQTTLLASFTNNWDASLAANGYPIQGTLDYGALGATGKWFYGYTTVDPSTYTTNNFIQMTNWSVNIAAVSGLNAWSVHPNGGFAPSFHAEKGRLTRFDTTYGSCPAGTARGMIRRWTSGVRGAVRIEGTAYIIQKRSLYPSGDGCILKIYVGNDLAVSNAVLQPTTGANYPNLTAPVSFCATGFVNVGTTVDVMMDRNASADGDFWEIFPHNISLLRDHIAKSSLDWEAAVEDGVPEQGMTDMGGVGQWYFGSITNTTYGLNATPGPSINNFLQSPYLQTRAGDVSRWFASTNSPDYYYNLSAWKRGLHPAGNASLGQLPYRWSIRRWKNNGPDMRVTVKGNPIISLYMNPAITTNAAGTVLCDGDNAHVYVDGTQIWSSFVPQTNLLGTTSFDGGGTFSYGGGVTHFLTNVLVKSGRVIDFAIDGNPITYNDAVYWDPVIVFEMLEPIKGTLIQVR